MDSADLDDEGMGVARSLRQEYVVAVRGVLGLPVVDQAHGDFFQAGPAATDGKHLPVAVRAAEQSGPRNGDCLIFAIREDTDPHPVIDPQVSLPT